ncbi:MAG: glutathione S-transferase family protein [Rhizobiaceae bacterium]|nr:glutathione S-transferase family protein [Rhizobiaceae bacterium]
MKLYSGGAAPNPQRVTIFLAEKGIEVDTKQFDIMKLEHKDGELGKINARQRLPVLVLDDGTVITETVAICRYFEEIHPTPPLMGIDAVDRAVVEMWQRRIELEFFMPVAYAFRHLHRAAAMLEPVQVPEWGELSQVRANEAMGHIDEELSTREFIAGERFSIADITAVCAYRFLRPARMKEPENLPNLKRWYDQMVARASMQ